MDNVSGALGRIGLASGAFRASTSLFRHLDAGDSLSATFTRPVRLAMVVQLAPAGSNPVEVGLGD